MTSLGKPFSPEEVHFLLMHGHLSSPAVFKAMVQDWPALDWSPGYLAAVLGERTLRFRTGPQTPASKAVLWETDCVFVDASLQQFCQWLEFDPASTHVPREDHVLDNDADSNPLQTYHPAHTWAYLDYKYMAELFYDQPDILEAIRWDDFGFPGRTGVESTIWVGSAGAHTPCHYDTYGCNLVLQVYGRKKWVLFPPEDSPGLYPTRLPYEESSVFSQVNVAHPDLHQHPRVVTCHPHVVVLEPGDVLFVPKHWWHYVESLSTSIAVNSWIEMASDVEDRLQEALVRLVLLSIKSNSNQSQWLNPTENVTSRAENLGFLQAALSGVQAGSTPECTFAGGCPFPQGDTKAAPPPNKRSKLRDSGRVEESVHDSSSLSPSTWFGPNLVPVQPCTDYFTDKISGVQTCDVTPDFGQSQDAKHRTNSTAREMESCQSNRKRTAAVLSSGKIAAEQHSAEEQTTVEKTAADSASTTKTAVVEHPTEESLAEQTSGEQTAAENTAVKHASCLLDHSDSDIKSASITTCPESTEALRSREQQVDCEEVENAVVNCLVQPQVMQEVAKMLKERLSLSQNF